MVGVGYFCLLLVGVGWWVMCVDVGRFKLLLVVNNSGWLGLVVGCWLGLVVVD